MNILYIEPYYSGSHKRWIDSYKKYSKHDITILHLPGNKWKWRMHGGAITLSNQFLLESVVGQLPFQNLIHFFPLILRNVI